MTLRLNSEARIHNFRNYPAALVSELRAALASGAPAEPDAHRPGFYDVLSGARRFYIHTAPDKSVWLLATWIARSPAAVENECMLAACS